MTPVAATYLRLRRQKQRVRTEEQKSDRPISSLPRDSAFSKSHSGQSPMKKNVTFQKDWVKHYAAFLL